MPWLLHRYFIVLYSLPCSSMGSRCLDFVVLGDQPFPQALRGRKKKREGKKEPNKNENKDVVASCALCFHRGRCVIIIVDYIQYQYST